MIGAESPVNRNALWATLLVEEWRRLGVTLFAVAPGSRSSPLALAAEALAPRCVVHWDERGLGFFALGHARATGRPAVVITTSGTAVANLMPAVVEAAMDHVPLLVVTADRPPELKDTGANQTIDQTHFFGRYARWYGEVGPSTPDIDPRHVLSVADHAWSRAMSFPPAPVHINVSFREPLAPINADDGSAEAWETLVPWRSSGQPLVRTVAGGLTLAEPDAQRLARAWSGMERGVILAGGGLRPAHRAVLLDLAVALDWPLLPDVGSGLRFADHPWVMSAADHLMLTDFSKANSPDVILQVGGRMTSKRMMTFARDAAPAARIRFGLGGHRDDPEDGITERVEAEIESLAAVVSFLAGDRTTDPDPQRMGPWSKAWARANEQVVSVLSDALAALPGITEPGVARAVSRMIPPDHVMFLGSSMPVRDMDMFAEAGWAGWAAANRGASGIDGTVASAVGFAEGADAKLTLVLGDLALLHDLNSLSLFAKAPGGSVAVVINNDGGGIFHFLPVAEDSARFETCFGTPHGMSFHAAAAQFGLAYRKPETMAAFEADYRSALASAEVTLIEVVTNRRENLAVHRDLQQRVRDGQRHD